MKNYHSQKEFLQVQYIEDIACNAKGYELLAVNDLRKMKK